MVRCCVMILLQFNPCQACLTSSVVGRLADGGVLIAPIQPPICTLISDTLCAQMNMASPGFMQVRIVCLHWPDAAHRFPSFPLSLSLFFLPARSRKRHDGVLDAPKRIVAPSSHAATCRCCCTTFAYPPCGRRSCYASNVAASCPRALVLAWIPVMAMTCNDPKSWHFAEETFVGCSHVKLVLCGNGVLSVGPIAPFLQG
ncbi:hypothetical protein B0I35DRAFT_84295 [Stachybotrys elegans]|uniref:Secreted protein n=1 Tax=Stachybotrys elegans TaxID=80388 RepID=A0A8K0SE70_9HYPO|nr:hypothetical protein B0I35DRAFT_84295 [Stachybotrys elegans]